MTLAHVLSLSRVVAAVPIAALILAGHGSALFWAAVVFAVASITDLLDGPLARRGPISPFGVYLDTTGDKVLVSVVLIALATTHLIDAWVAMVIVGREFLVTGVRTLASVEGQVIPANFAGKVKTTVTLIAIVYVLVIASARQHGFVQLGLGASIWWSLAWWAMIVAVILTAYSGARYILDARDLFTRGPASPADQDATS
jgi:CDP-diacylglycerol--glycerol-3-phosphate 3-phosphatidyltransferase